ncbi:hypothetical protein RPMA_17975 [Tardiphaga alba]|uniref:Uncharacterized protein n=1 Tax=Tardiphaga alba TaxID=340268 RepID=A0ABX8ADQ4_9BRAD|nr:hypothetical protein [Tardiphaga alba]QUS40510.1 hypothetical protein RPMA_17975 [Tardiphaga alba]
MTPTALSFLANAVFCVAAIFGFLICLLPTPARFDRCRAQRSVKPAHGSWAMPSDQIQDHS